MEENKRNSNIELLRILCIIFIILHHSFVHSNFEQTNSLNYNILSIIQILGKLANNIFIIITGYYMVNKKIKIKSILKIILEIIFYSYSILALYLIFFPQNNVNIIISLLTPISSNNNWFITLYLLLYMTIPFLNILINNMDKKQFSKLLILQIVCFSILPTISLLRQYFSSYIWFVCLYMIGAYLRIYSNQRLIDNNNKLIVLCSITTILFLVFAKFHQIEYDINNFILFMLSVCIFIYFIKKTKWYRKEVNYLASSVLGIYLLHDNPIVRYVIWEAFNIPDVINTNYFWIYEIGIILLIFSSCFIIDQIRYNLVERPIFKIIEKTEKV